MVIFFHIVPPTTPIILFKNEDIVGTLPPLITAVMTHPPAIDASMESEEVILFKNEDGVDHDDFYSNFNENDGKSKFICFLNYVSEMIFP